MPVNTRRRKEEQEESTEEITGSWNTPGMDETIQELPDDEIPPVKPAAFVRCLTQVGRITQGSIVPAASFEFLQNLLECGAVEYDYTATEELFAGDEHTRQLLASVDRPVALTVPQAPWATAAAANLLGAHYASILNARFQAMKPTLKPVPTESFEV